MRKITFVRLDCRVSTHCHYVLNFLFTIKLWEIQRFVVDRDFLAHPAGLHYGEERDTQVRCQRHPHAPASVVSTRQ